jgi:hypothetical protein
MNIQKLFSDGAKCKQKGGEKLGFMAGEISVPDDFDSLYLNLGQKY